MAERNQVTCLSQVGILPGLEAKPCCTELIMKTTPFLCSELTGLSKQLHLEALC